jgi:hypothetical protein
MWYFVHVVCFSCECNALLSLYLFKLINACINRDLSLHITNIKRELEIINLGYHNQEYLMIFTVVTSVWQLHWTIMVEEWNCEGDRDGGYQILS